MAVGIVDRQKLVNIADAVRAKKGITGNMTLDAIASNITSMPTADNNAKFDFAGSGSKSSGNLAEYLTSIDLTGLDTNSYTNMRYMFNSYYSLTSLDLSSFNTSKVIDMSSMFYSCSSLTSLDVSSFDTSKVTDMNNMFQTCKSLTSIDVSSFNTSKVKNMSEMFGNCNSLTSLDVRNFDTSSVGTSSYTSFKGMFNSCSSLKSLDISSFDLSNTYGGEYYSLSSMFFYCKNLKTLKLPNSVSFNKTNIYFSSMFHSCYSLESLDLTGWDTTNVLGMSSMFYSCNSLKNLTLGENWASNSSISSFDLSSCPLTHESAVDVINKLATRDNSPVIEFSNQVGLYQSEIDVATNKGWSVSGCTVLVEDPTTATVGQDMTIDGVPSKCVYVADTPQDWGQRIFGSLSEITDSNGNSTFQWGRYRNAAGIPAATGITATKIGTGLSNTNALLDMNIPSTDGTPTIWDVLKEFRTANGDRWFIPSRDEGFESYKQGMGEMWTSSEYNHSNAYATSDDIKKYSSMREVKSAFAFTYV